MTVTIPVATAPKPLIAMLRRQPAPRSRSQWTTIPRLRQGDRGEDADGVQRDERLDPPAERGEHDDREDREGDDPGAEREPLAAEREPAGHEPVAREERRQPREVGEAVLAARIRMPIVASCRT